MARLLFVTGILLLFALHKIVKSNFLLKHLYENRPRSIALCNLFLHDWAWDAFENNYNGARIIIRAQCHGSAYCKHRISTYGSMDFCAPRQAYFMGYLRILASVLAQKPKFLR